MKNGRFGWGMGAAAAVLMGTGLVVAGVSARPVEAASIDNTPDPRLVVASFTSADDGANLAMKRTGRCSPRASLSIFAGCVRAMM